MRSLLRGAREQSIMLCKARGARAIMRRAPPSPSKAMKLWMEKQVAAYLNSKKLLKLKKAAEKKVFTPKRDGLLP